MALDGYMYDENKTELDYFPIDDSLHNAIFENSSKLYLSCTQLRKLRDYYKDAKFNGDEVHQLAKELQRYKEFIRKDHHNQVENLIRKLLNFDVAEVAFYAD
jgi:DNA repair ATPase RecN